MSRTNFLFERLSTSDDFERPNRVIDSLPNKLTKILGIHNRATYKDLPLITKDSPINGGVFMGKSPREAIVADLNGSKYFQRLIGIAETLYKQNSSKLRNNEFTMLNIINNLIIEGSTHTHPIVIDEYIKTNKLDNDILVNLDQFFKDGFTVCRHLALGVGLLTEYFINQGLLKGTVSIDRNTRLSPTTQRKEGHAWVRYTQNKNNKVYILDPTLRYIGSLEKVQIDRQLGKELWPYERNKDNKNLISAFEA